MLITLNNESFVTTGLYTSILTLYGYNSSSCNRSGTALVRPSIIVADLTNCQSSLAARTAGRISGGAPHQAAIFVPEDVTWLGGHTEQNQTTSFNSLTVLQSFDDGGTPLWEHKEMGANQGRVKHVIKVHVKTLDTEPHL